MEIAKRDTGGCSIEILNRLESLEDNSRRNNLRFKGITEHPNVTWEHIAKHVHKLAKYKLEFIENLTIERARRVAPTNAFKPRIILAKFLKYSDK